MCGASVFWFQVSPQAHPFEDPEAQDLVFHYGESSARRRPPRLKVLLLELVDWLSVRQCGFCCLFGRQEGSAMFYWENGWSLKNNGSTSGCFPAETFEHPLFAKGRKRYIMIETETENESDLAHRGFLEHWASPLPAKRQVSAILTRNTGDSTFQPEKPEGPMLSFPLPFRP